MRRHTKLGARPNAVVVTRDTRVVPMDLWPIGSSIAVVSYSRQRTWVVDVASGAVTDVDLGPVYPASWQRRAP